MFAQWLYLQIVYANTWYLVKSFKRVISRVIIFGNAKSPCVTVTYFNDMKPFISGKARIRDDCM